MIRCWSKAYLSLLLGPLTGSVPSPIPGSWAAKCRYAWPCNLNAAICHDHCHTWTMEEITHELAVSTKFTKLNNTLLCYFFVVAVYKSPYLTTKNSLFGWCHFLYLPFRLTSEQDIFQHMVDQILGRCDGAMGIANNITVHSKNDSQHDQYLCKYM